MYVLNHHGDGRVAVRRQSTTKLCSTRVMAVSVSPSIMVPPPRFAPAEAILNDAALRIGSSGTCGSFGQGFVGLLDEVGIHSRALSADEVAAVYNAGSYGKCAIRRPENIFTDGFEDLP